MQHALDLELLSLTDDVEAQRWCCHEETLVRASLLHAVGREKFTKIDKTKRFTNQIQYKN